MMEKKRFLKNMEKNPLNNQVICVIDLKKQSKDEKNAISQYSERLSYITSARRSLHGAQGLSSETRHEGRQLSETITFNLESTIRDADKDQRKKSEAENDEEIVGMYV